MNDITIIIKTFERYSALKRLLVSIDKYFNNIPVIVVDDSKKNYRQKILKQFKNMNLNYIVTEYDIGLSKGRNILLDSVTTKYFLLCDDDFEFDERTNISYALSMLKKEKLDILGGVVYNKISLNTLYSFAWCFKKISRILDALKGKEFISIYNGHFDISNDCIKLNINKKFENFNKNDIYNVDICSNFFVAKLDSIKKIGGWKNDVLKVGEHELFFLNAKKNNLKIGFSPKYGTMHYPEKKMSYLKFRLRASQYFKEACKIEKLPSFIIKDEKDNIIYSYEN